MKMIMISKLLCGGQGGWVIERNEIEKFGKKLKNKK